MSDAAGMDFEVFGAWCLVDGDGVGVIDDDCCLSFLCSFYDAHRQTTHPAGTVVLTLTQDRINGITRFLPAGSPAVPS